MNPNLLPTTSHELLALCNLLFLICACPANYVEYSNAKRRHNEAARAYNSMVEPEKHLKQIK